MLKILLIASLFVACVMCMHANTHSSRTGTSKCKHILLTIQMCYFFLKQKKCTVYTYHSNRQMYYSTS